MENRLRLEIITPEKVLLDERVDEVTAPGAEGEFGALPGHCDFMTLLKVGEVSYRKSGKTGYVAVSQGFAEIGREKVVILVETAESPADIDRDRAEKKKREAEKILSDKSLDEHEFLRTEISLQKALIRMQVAERPGA